MKQIILIGAGGLAREVLAIIDASNKINNANNEVLGYVVEKEYYVENQIIAGKKVLGDIDWALKNKAGNYFICCIGDVFHRHRILRRFIDADSKFVSVVHPSVINLGNFEIGDGTVIAPGSIVSDMAKLGSHVYINLGSTIGHDAVIGDYSIISPGVHLSGNVEIGTGCLIGTGANIIERKKIGRWATVAVGSTVFDDVPDNAIVVGNPARIMKIKEEGWHLNYEK